MSGVHRLDARVQERVSVLAEEGLLELRGRVAAGLEHAARALDQRVHLLEEARAVLDFSSREAQLAPQLADDGQRIAELRLELELAHARPAQVLGLLRRLEPRPARRGCESLM